MRSNTPAAPQLQQISESGLRCALRAAIACRTVREEEAVFFGVIILPKSRAASVGVILARVLIALFLHCNGTKAKFGVKLVIMFRHEAEF